MKFVVLPVKMHGRLLFGLCRSCCAEARVEYCHHEQTADREFTGTWVADELCKAVELGYRISEIYHLVLQLHIWQYNTTLFDGTKGGLFVQYVNLFLKIKQEASSWPSWCINEEAKARYLAEHDEMRVSF